MKGIVFTEFLGMVSSQFGSDAVDDIIEMSDLASHGAYTSVGTYPHSELVQLLRALSSISKIPSSQLVESFGIYLFGRFAVAYPRFFVQPKSAIEFLNGIESVIHVEVKKLYPDAELPRFDVEEISASHIVLRYESAKQMSDLALGLIKGCITHFQTPMRIDRESVSTTKGIEICRFRVLTQAS